MEDLDVEIIKSPHNQCDYSSNIKVFNLQNDDEFMEYQEMIANPKLKNIGIDKFGDLCNELKELYTAVTRARKKLIIFDQNTKKGDKIKEIWKKLNLLEFISESDFQMEEANNKNVTISKFYFIFYYNLLIAKYN